MNIYLDDLDSIYNLNKDAFPMKFNFLSSLNLEDDVKRRLSIHLSNVVKGYDTSLLTPIGKSEDPDHILAGWDKIYKAKRHLINEELNHLEISNRSKFGPRSIAKPWSERLRSTTEYFSKDSCRLQADTLFTQTSSGVLRPLQLKSASSFLKNSTNSGLPFYTRKGTVKDEVVSDFNALLDRRDPCILFTRTQEGSKTRDVWGFPIVDTLNEMKYYQPLLNYQKSLSWRSALLGPESTDKSVTSMVTEAINNNNLLVSIDFSGYDKTLKKELQRASFNYIKSLFQNSCKEEIDYIFDRFNTIGLVTPSGILSGEHGVPSGSTFTNEVDSISQYLILRYSKGILDCQIQGDDGAYLVKDLKSLESIYNSFELAGNEVNDEKSYKSKKFIIYLQNLYHIDYIKNGLIGGIYPTYRALNRILFQERWTDFEEFDLEGIDYYSIRTLSILENCKHHPLFSDLVRYVKSLDKYGLRFNRKSVVKYDRMQNNDSGVGGILNNQYGDKVSGIANFESYKLLKD